jgi:hypothetical protein
LVVGLTFSSQRRKKKKCCPTARLPLSNMDKQIHTFSLCPCKHRQGAMECHQKIKG